jgi:hypothetical protein
VCARTAKLYSDATLTGTFALKFYDYFGDSFKTKPIILEDYTQRHIGNIPALEQPGPSTCSDIVTALESLPDNIIPSNSVVCQEKAFGVGYAAECGQTYTLTFTGNPGYLKNLEVDYYLDGDRATIFNQLGEAGANVTTEVFTNGNVGDVDYFAKRCNNVFLKTKFLADADLGVNRWGYLDEIAHGEYRDLVKCLGDSDGILLNNVEVYNMDYGGEVHGSSGLEHMGGNPHLVKLVPKEQSDLYDRSRLALVWVSQVNTSDQVGGATDTPLIWMANPPDDEETTFIPYATDGVAEVVFYDSDGDEMLEVFGPSEPRVTARFSRGSNLVYTSYDVSCETGDAEIHPCLDKGDMIYLFDANWGRRPSNTSAFIFGGGDYMTSKFDLDKPLNWWKYNNYNPNTGQPYVIKKIYKAKTTATTYAVEDRYRIVLDKAVNWGTYNTTQGEDPDGDGVHDTGFVQLIKFSPATTGNYHYFSECSHRGKCFYEVGVCDCDPGYYGLACDIEDTLNF